MRISGAPKALDRAAGGWRCCARERWVRKLRWRAPGPGKRGGYRVIYFARIERGVIWMLTIHPKNVKDTIPADVLRRIRQEVDNVQEES
jgi:hypothetical protein